MTTTEFVIPDSLGVISGSGLYNLDALTQRRTLSKATPFGEASGELVAGTWHGHRVVFLSRHGLEHCIPPHLINYRANIWAMHEAGVSGIIIINCVGGIHPELDNGRIAIPDQLIDYTWGRESSFFKVGDEVKHIDMTYPFSADFRNTLLKVKKDFNLYDGGVYGSCQGPRLETAAEINRLERDGVDMVGMTATPEAFLIRELELPCAMISMMVNRAAGRGDGVIDQADVSIVLAQGMAKIQEMIGSLLLRNPK